MQLHRQDTSRADGDWNKPKVLTLVSCRRVHGRVANGSVNGSANLQSPFTKCQRATTFSSFKNDKPQNHRVPSSCSLVLHFPSPVAVILSPFQVSEVPSTSIASALSLLTHLPPSPLSLNGLHIFFVTLLHLLPDTGRSLGSIAFISNTLPKGQGAPNFTRPTTIVPFSCNFHCTAFVSRLIRPPECAKEP